VLLRQNLQRAKKVVSSHSSLIPISADDQTRSSFGTTRAKPFLALDLNRTHRAGQELTLLPGVEKIRAHCAVAPL